jgi:hypothetical protein
MCEGIVDYGVEQGADGSRIQQRPDHLKEWISSQHKTDDRFHSGRIHRRAKTLQTRKLHSHGLLDNHVLTGLAPRGFGSGKAALRYPLALPVLPHHPPPRPASSFCAFIYR